MAIPFGHDHGHGHGQSWSIRATPRKQDLEGGGDSGVELTWQVTTAALFLLWVRVNSENLFKALDLLPRKLPGAFVPTV